ncbi:hypothetical protein AMTR_s00010p00264560 [Amborella trichopoda]|uniref:Uncharacterized protein n=1 Tax=Amborella trichopoda TaxID=13333 RepID=W1NGA9_AMBTC|nr:hypothetical protein AMTR_s00010p00264560 [Amborella trichopoda]
MEREVRDQNSRERERARIASHRIASHHKNIFAFIMRSWLWPDQGRLLLFTSHVFHPRGAMPFASCYKWGPLPARATSAYLSHAFVDAQIKSQIWGLYETGLDPPYLGLGLDYNPRPNGSGRSPGPGHKHIKVGARLRQACEVRIELTKPNPALAMRP